MDLNNACVYCGCQLWGPNVSNINGVEKKKCWYKVSHYTNKTKKLKTSSWVLKGYEESFFSSKDVDRGSTEISKEMTVRKISPALYMKNQLKGFFDIAIFDEVHAYKGGGTAQGNAMHSLVKSSKKHLALTGTIAGGFAEHLFYLFYRLDPSRMRKYGYKYTDLIKFVEKYGTLESVYEMDIENIHNQSSRGKKIGSTKAKPGISPLIFRDFLMDKAVFLDLSDMGRYLPPLIEEVVTVPLSEDIFSEYKRVIQKLNNVGGNKFNPMMSAMLQFSLSYPDKMDNYDPMIHPKTGEVVITPRKFDMFNLTPKEEKLIEIINDELEQHRNVFVYCEYTGEGNQNISKRLLNIIESNCDLNGQVALLESSRPKPIEREAWIHKKAQEGIKVFITNPRCVETGCALASIA
jgi:superfamily II DNA or RNA helicase